MINGKKCKKCGQTKDQRDFYKNSKSICKLCNYTPKHMVSIVVTTNTNKTIEFSGVINYKFEGGFLFIEDSNNIEYIREDFINRITIKKQLQPQESFPVTFKSSPVIL